MMFVDGQNLFHGAKQFDENLDIDFVSLADELTDGRDLIRSYYFDSFVPEKRDDKEGFYTFLETNGYRVIAEPLRERDEGYVEKGADIGLATELIAQGFGGSYEVAVVVTGDDDFSKAIRYVQDQGKTVEVASFDANLSSGLERTADSITFLGEITDSIRR